MLSGLDLKSRGKIGRDQHRLHLLTASAGAGAGPSDHKYGATIWMRWRIASPEMLSGTEVLPHLICSPPVGGGDDFDEAGEYGSAR